MKEQISEDKGNIKACKNSIQQSQVEKTQKDSENATDLNPLAITK